MRIEIGMYEVEGEAFKLFYDGKIFELWRWDRKKREWEVYDTLSGFELLKIWLKEVGYGLYETIGYDFEVYE